MGGGDAHAMNKVSPIIQCSMVKCKPKNVFTLIRLSNLPFSQIT